MRRALPRCVLILVLALGAGDFRTLAAHPAAAAASAWVNVTGTLANMASECGNLTMVSAVPGSDNIIAGIARNGLWVNGNGSTWAQLAGSSIITNRPSSITYDPAHPGVFWESGIYGTGGGASKPPNTATPSKNFVRKSITAKVAVVLGNRSPKRCWEAGHGQSQTVHRPPNAGHIC